MTMHENPTTPDGARNAGGAASSQPPLHAAPRTTQPPSPTDKASSEARDVGREGAEGAKQVAGTATQEASKVAHEAGDQAKNLLDELGTELREQAGTQQQRVADGLRSIGGELRSMAEHGEPGGTASSLVGQAAQRAGSAADWLDHRDPGSLVSEVKDFARRRPGAFLAVAAGAGLLVGRLTRGLAGAQQDSQAEQAGHGTSGAQPATARPAVPPTMATDRGTQPTPASPHTTAPQPSIDTVGPTIGSGGVGGTGSDPGVASPGISAPGVPGTTPDERR